MHKDVFVVKGLAGEKTLDGTIAISGAKNVVLKTMAASLLFKDTITIKNVPHIEDVSKLTTLLETAGATVDTSRKHQLTIDSRSVTNTALDQEVTKSMRASIVVTGPMLARYGRVSVVQPGGCVIGSRPIDQYLEAYQKMGATIDVDGDTFTITAQNGKLKGAEIIFPFQTVGGTETLMMAAILARGKTVLKNCAMEPEITSLAEYLVSCGAKITGIGTTTLEITGGGLLRAGKKPYITIPDRIEAGSFLLLGALCANNLKLTNCNPAHLEVVIALLKNAGVPIIVTKNSIEIKGNGTIPNASFKGFGVRTHEYPGFPTDLQAQLVAFLTQVTGENVVFETIFEGRFKYTDDLMKMGANITVMNPREIMVKGPVSLVALTDEELRAYDIRAGFASVMVALVARGNSTINSIYFIDRGYENLEGRLRAIGADIQRIKVGE